ncbi:Cleavage and polyadenylation specificity factor subunit 3 [Dissostichus eleginoides]|uniref:Cleavage and polyadenylation specificity factor subunit 3 n=1 Tax=Dissostichus eleginoides TaxID=100907 RepID=A0AAD9B314_DISEL|nr:Cleavage and polyadenylation specificity factor subunit 3 [Dissostichus eleginoides]
MATKRKCDATVPAEESDQLLIRPLFHLDHCGALPWFLQKTSFKGRTFMTHATKAIYRWLLSDYVKVSNISADDMLYTETDLEESMEKIETINFHEVKEESTYGTHIHEKREERESRFCNTVQDIVNREGRCLIPVFALGRAQELLLILGE